MENAGLHKRRERDDLIASRVSDPLRWEAQIRPFNTVF